MTKKATITVKLVPEASEESNNAIKNQIMKESEIPFCAKVEKVTITEVGNPYRELREHGFSKKVARNIVRFYEG